MSTVHQSAVPPKKAPLLTPLLLLFMLAMILANIGGNMYGGLMPLYLERLGANVTEIGLFFTLSQIIPLSLQILGGWVSDTLGRLRAIAFGSVAGLCGYVALILAPSWEWVLVTMAFGSVSGALVGASFDAFIAEHSDDHNRARVFGISQALFQIVSVAGPVLGGVLAEKFGFRVMLLVAAAFYGVATLMRVAMARQASQTEEEGASKKLSVRGLLDNLGTMFGLLFAGGVVTWILITDGVRDISFALSFNFMPIYQEDIAHLTLGQIGLLNSVFGLFTMLTVIPGGWLADKKGERVGIVSGFVLIFVALQMFINANSIWLSGAAWAMEHEMKWLGQAISNVWLFGLAWAIAGTGVGLMMPAYQSLISKAVPKKVRGTAFGLFNTSLGLVSLPAPMIGAFLWDKIGPWFPFAITAWVSLIAVIPAWLKFKIEKKVDNGEEINADTTK